jgi:galactose-1-phosphate uridylyltransferase
LRPLAASQVGAGAFIGDCLPEEAATQLRAALNGSADGRHG